MARGNHQHFFIADRSKFEVLDFRNGSEADIEAPPINVRFTPKSGHCLSVSGRPLCANSGHHATNRQYGFR